MREKESPSVGKSKCPICGGKVEGRKCHKCGHLMRPSD
jgi:hypothetical protein